MYCENCDNTGSICEVCKEADGECTCVDGPELINCPDCEDDEEEEDIDDDQIDSDESDDDEVWQDPLEDE